jgi:hypothetical protein
MLQHIHVADGLDPFDVADVGSLMDFAEEADHRPKLLCGMVTNRVLVRLDGGSNSIEESCHPPCPLNNARYSSPMPDAPAADE